MTKAPIFSRRGALRRSLAALVALIGVPMAGGFECANDTAAERGRASGGAVYRRFDEYGRVILEIRRYAPSWEWTSYGG